MIKGALISYSFLLLLTSVQANTISESQQKYLKKYENQKSILKPEKMLINTETEPAIGADFIPLFNGKDLSGWTARGGRCIFKVNEETIEGVCLPGSPSTYLCTNKDDYKNFIFTAEVKWLIDGNSGIMIRSKARPGNNGYEHIHGPQIEMEGFSHEYAGRGWSGGIFGQGYSAWIYPLWLDAHREARAALIKEGWNRVTIKAEDDTIKTWINGVPAAHWKTNDYPEGFLGLQIHSGKEGTVRFRNLLIKEL